MKIWILSCPVQSHSYFLDLAEKSTTEDDQPPDDVKDIDVFPSTEDMRNGTPYLRKNIIAGERRKGENAF